MYIMYIRAHVLIHVHDVHLLVSRSQASHVVSKKANVNRLIVAL